MKQQVALIGAGGHGSAHLQALEHFQDLGTVDLVAAADPALERDLELRDSVSRLGAACFIDYLEMLHKHPALDAVVICTPIPLHERMVKDCLRDSGARILLEKPPVPTLRQLEDLIALDESKRVRVGFHMNFWPQTRELKRHLVSKKCGSLQTVSITAGWPRTTDYYQRASWSGRLSLQGEPVFDGPATNALSHLIHNTLFLLGEEESSYAMPECIEARLTHARPIESYDTARIRAAVGPVVLEILLTHALEQYVPFEVVLRGSGGELRWRESEPRVLENGIPFPTADFHFVKCAKFPMYEEFLGPEKTFHSMLGTLNDMRPFVFLMHGALLSSGGTHPVQEHEILPGDSKLYRLGKVSEALASIRENSPDTLPDTSWLRMGETVSEPDSRRFLALLGL